MDDVGLQRAADKTRTADARQVPDHDRQRFDGDIGPTLDSMDLRQQDRQVVNEGVRGGVEKHRGDLAKGRVCAYVNLVSHKCLDPVSSSKLSCTGSEPPAGVNSIPIWLPVSE